MDQIKSFRITKLLIQETGTYNEQVRRRYETKANGHVLNQLQERLAGVTDYQAPQFAGIANQFIAPMSTPEKSIDIAHGWGERRMRFMMEVEIELFMGSRLTEVILGWTSHFGLAHTGQLDPKMEFFVNSTLHVRETMAMTPSGRDVMTSVVDNSHILVDPSWSGIYSPEIDNRLRPEDVFSTMSRTHLNGLGRVYDGRSAASNVAVKSRRSNGSAASYMADILRGYTQATTMADMGAGEQEILMKARGFAQENVASGDYFLAAVAGLRGMGVSNVFQFRDLQTLDPAVESVTKVSILGPTQQATVHHAGQTEFWGTTTKETDAATILSQSVPAMLMDVALTKVNFRSTNHTINMQPNTVFMDARGFSKGDLSQAVQFFKNQFEHTVMMDLTFGNQISYAVEMSVDLLGETWIKISLDGGPFVDYVTPSFCDALMVPVLTKDPNAAVTLASDFEQLAVGLQESAKDNHPSIMSAGGSVFGNI